MTAAVRRPKVDWRSALTAEEAEFMRRADEDAKRIADLQRAWCARYQAQRIAIVNAAVRRAASSKPVPVA
jgi:hypothetical protein